MDDFIRGILINILSGKRVILTSKGRDRFRAWCNENELVVPDFKPISRELFTLDKDDQNGSETEIH